MVDSSILLYGEEQLENNLDNFCEFWINNFQFEIFYDLSKLGCNSPSTPDNYEYFEEKQDELNIHTLPTEILSYIFKFMTAVELLAVRGVCKRWQDIVEFDKSLWNHITFTANDLDVKTTASLIREMPLLRTVHLCNVYSPDDMSFLINTVCHACWELHSLHFPDNCIWHPSSHELHLISYYHPKIKKMTLATKQKLSSTDLLNISEVLSSFTYLTDLQLIGYYWIQKELFEELLPNIQHLNRISLPSCPGISPSQLKQLVQTQPYLKNIVINTSSISGPHINNKFFNQLSMLKIIDRSTLSADKLKSLGELSTLKSLEVNLSNSNKDQVLEFFNKGRHNLEELIVSNCEYSIHLLTALPKSCPNLRVLIWLNPKDISGELTDEGVFAITQLKSLAHLEIKSRSVSKAYYPNLAAMKCLKYVRINGMRVPGCS